MYLGGYDNRELGFLPLVALPALAAGGSLAATIASVFGGPSKDDKIGASATKFGFVANNYPDYIYQAERAIREYKNAIAGYTGESLVPPPPQGSYGGKPTGVTFAQMLLDIVPRYVSGAEARIKKGDNKLEQPNNVYEQVFAKQNELLNTLKNRLAALQQSGQASAPGGPQVSPVQTQPQPSAPSLMVQLPGVAPPNSSSPYIAPIINTAPPPMTSGPSQPSYGAPPQTYATPYPVPATYEQPALMQSSMFGNIPVPMLIIGGMGLVLLLATQGNTRRR